MKSCCEEAQAICRDPQRKDPRPQTLELKAEQELVSREERERVFHQEQHVQRLRGKKDLGTFRQFQEAG